MAALTVQGLRDYVRSFLDTDAEELPDSLVDVWRDEGVNRIQRTFEPWSFYESSWDVTTDQASFAFTDDLDTVTSIEAPNWMLRYMAHAAAVKKWAWGDTTGLPYEFSLWSNTIFLWPPPSQSQTYTVRGYRVPTAASAALDTLDLPDEFGPLVAEWMLARAYEQQDDLFMSQQKFARFDQELEVLRRRYTRPSNADVVAIGQDCSLGLAQFPQRLIYDWE